MNIPFKQVNQILFLDIETASLTRDLDELNTGLKEAWIKKISRQIRRKTDPPKDLSFDQLYIDKGAIFSEFAKIVCISVGYFKKTEDDLLAFRVKSFYRKNERQLLMDFHSLLNTHFNHPHQHFICGHNIKEFDIPFICRRSVIHSLQLPELLSVSGKKPWEIKYLLDTLELWKFGDYKNYTSLSTLCAVFDIPTPKDDISGADVSKVYWEGGIQRIKTYCEKDVIATARLFLKLMRWKELKNEQVEYP